jgi:hypothetical protein
VRGELAAARERDRVGHVGAREHAAPDRVLQGEQAGDGEVRVVGLDRRLDHGEVERAVRQVRERLRLYRAQHRGTSRLVAVGMRLLADDDLLPALAVRHERGEVGLGPGGEEEALLHAEALGGDFLQSVDGRVVAEDVVAHGGLGHGAAHRGRGLRDGVAAKIDHFHGWILPRRP